MMEKYLYLAHEKHVDNWIKGKKVPIYRSSKYVSPEEQRGGIHTPDETKQIKSNANSMEDFDPLLSRDSDLSSCQNVNIADNYVIDEKGNSRKMAEYSQHTEDVYILCFCESFELSIMKKLGKNYCIKIKDIELLKRSIDYQLNCLGKAAPVMYTSKMERHHYLKSDKDEWQNEYRLCWSIDKRTDDELEVEIPLGICERMSFTA